MVRPWCCEGHLSERPRDRRAELAIGHEPEDRVRRAGDACCREAAWRCRLVNRAHDDRGAPRGGGSSRGRRPQLGRGGRDGPGPLVGRAMTGNRREVGTDATTAGEWSTVSAGPQPIDWPSFWRNETVEHEWFCEPMIPKGRQVALFGNAKAGKSLLALEIAAAKAT